MRRVFFAVSVPLLVGACAVFAPDSGFDQESVACGEVDPAVLDHVRDPGIAGELCGLRRAQRDGESGQRVPVRAQQGSTDLIGDRAGEDIDPLCIRLQGGLVHDRRFIQNDDVRPGDRVGNRDQLRASNRGARRHSDGDRDRQSACDRIHEMPLSARASVQSASGKGKFSTSVPGEQPSC